MARVVNTGNKEFLCPRGCGKLKRTRSIDFLTKTTRCKKCKGIFLTKDEIRQWEKKRAPYNKMRNNALFHLLESGHNGNLPCPLCSNKMKELSLSYVKSMVASSNEEMVKDPAQYAIAIVFEMIPIIGDIISLANAVGRIESHGENAKLNSVTIDGCSSCLAFWFDRGEILQIMGNDVILKYKGVEVKIAPPGTAPSSNVVATRLDKKNAEVKVAPHGTTPSSNVVTGHVSEKSKKT
tara:strand:+ start:313 stop:1023 length:711 start_codon:yes stop_codon:yes gene_type:complete